MMKIMNKILLCCVSVFLFPCIIFSLDISIENNEFHPYSKDTVKTVLIKNDGDSIYAGEILIKKRKDKNSGEEQLTPCTDFSFYPSRILLPPDEEISVTVTWIGPSNIDSEQAYRFIVSQKNFSNRVIGDKKVEKEPKFNLSVYLDMHKSLFVLPDKGKADTQLISLSVTKNFLSISSSKNVHSIPKIKLVLLNKGNLKEIISNVSLVIYSLNEFGQKVESSKFSFSPKELQGRFLILPRGEREFILDWPEKFPVSESISGTIDFQRETSTQ